jgi:hypothetical protein
MLVRVRDFGHTHGHLFPESSVAREQFATVATAVKQLSEYAVSKMSAKQEGKNTKTLAREALRNRLEAMALTARAIARDTPGFADKFRLPKPRTDQELVTAGRLFARDAEVFKERFLAHAMPQTFIADLIALVDTFEQAIHEREAGKGGQSAARASITAALASSTAAVDKLDAMVTNHLRDDPATTALWWSARRVGHPRRPRRAAVLPAPVPFAATTAPPAATLPPAAAPSQTTDRASVMEGVS